MKKKIRKFGMIMNDEKYKTKKEAIMRRKLLNADIKRVNKESGYIAINLKNKVLRGKSGWIVRPFSLRRIK